MNWKKILIAALVLLQGGTASAQKNPKNINTNWETDTTKHLVPLDSLTVLLPPDKIPPIDEPGFWDKEEALKNYDPLEPVVSIEIDGVAKAYPISVLTYHEVVNDQAGQYKICVNYCPLCNTTAVYNRELVFRDKTYTLDFGVSGMLRNSNLVLWDRQTQSWWQQLTARAIVGRLAGAEIETLPAFIISLSDFLASYPKGKVLSTETGHNRDYGKNPYVNYDSPENTWPRLFNPKPSTRLPAVERITNVTVNGKHKIYPFSAIANEQVINDSFEGKKIVIFYTEDMVSALDKETIAHAKKTGAATVFSSSVNNKLLSFEKKDGHFTDVQTQSHWDITGKCTHGPYKGKKLRPLVHGNHFAFAWLAFYPESEIYNN